MSDEVLKFDGVSYLAKTDLFSSLRDVSFSLAAGETLLVRADGEDEHVPVVDLAVGLLEPDAGGVEFKGCDWRGMDAYASAAARGRIGCVYEKPGWISSLSVAQNVVLRERHHSSRTDEEIYEEAQELVSLIGLSGLSEMRPDMVRQRQLRMFEWVRACMGKPELIVLAFPERDMASYTLTHLIDLVERMAAGGTAVLWMTTNREVWEHGRLCNVRQCAIERECWTTLRGRD